MMNANTADAINERAAEEFFLKATTAEKEGNPEKAIEFYERALNENPDHELACFNLAVLYDRRAEDSKAIELYERLCTSEPVHISALLNLAVLYEDNNMYEESRRCLMAVLRTDPNHPRASLFLKDVESARSMYSDDEDRARRSGNVVMDVPISDFELSVRSRNCLKKMDIKTLGDLLRVTEQELLSFKNFGETSLNEIKALLSSKGLRLGQAVEPAIPSAARRIATGGSVTGMPSLAPSFGGESVSNYGGSVGGGGAVDTGGSEIVSKRVEDLELSVRSRKALQRLNIITVGELISRTEDELLGCKNFGHTSLNEIKQILGTLGVHLRRLDGGH
ncbi:MAG: DNA-directed RNA polymerase subunit alpha C-terminal domain-containing protein [Tepidisphaeraceae bacterium]